MQFETNIFCNLRQIHFAIWDIYALQFMTINFEIWDKYILQFKTNTLCNLRQIHFAIWDKWSGLVWSGLVFLCFCVFVFLCFCLFVFLSFCLMVFLSGHHADQISEGSEVSKVTLCVKILKWRWVSQSVTDQGQV